MSSVKVDTNGACFLCLKHLTDDEDDDNHESTDPSLQVIHSFKMLTRYLKLDLGGWFLATPGPAASTPEGVGPIGSGVGAEVSVSVSLCLGCGDLTRKFSVLYQLLDLVRLEVEAAVREIHGVMVVAVAVAAVGVEEEKEGIVLHKNSFQSGGGGGRPSKPLLSSGGGRNGNRFRFADSTLSEQLRKEVVRKCSSSIRRMMPRVSLAQLDSNGLNPTRSLHHHHHRQTDRPVVTPPSSPPLLQGLLKGKGTTEGQFHGIPRDSGTIRPLEVEAVKALKKEWLLWRKKEVEVVRRRRRRRRQPTQAGGASQCRVCKIKYFSRGNLRRHYQANHNGVPKQVALVCDVQGCSAYFRTQRQLTHHKSKAHLIIQSRARGPMHSQQGDDTNKSGAGAPPEDPPPLDPRDDHVFKCRLPNCTATSFNSVHQLDSHLEQVHAKWCNICGSEFATNANLRRHRYGVHMKELTTLLIFTCRVEGCGRKFEHAKEVRWHHSRKHQNMDDKLKLVDLAATKVAAGEIANKPNERLHGGIKKPRKRMEGVASLPCPLCGKRFADNFRLKRHVNKSHSSGSAERAFFQCSFCSRKCSSKQTRIEHERTHTGEKYFCRVCEASYVSKHQMRYHKMKKHPQIDPDDDDDLHIK